MQKSREQYKLFILLFLFWILLTSDYSVFNIGLGVFTAYIITRASRNVLYDKGVSMFKFPPILTLIRYLFILLIEIYKSSITHINCIIKKDCDPIVVEVVLEVEDPLLVTIIANSITLTPGTITVDTEGSVLKVLSIKDYGDNGERTSREIKEKFEKIFIR